MHDVDGQGVDQRYVRMRLAGTIEQIKFPDAEKARLAQQLLNGYPRRYCQVCRAPTKPKHKLPMTDRTNWYGHQAEYDEECDSHVQGEHDLGEVERCFGTHIPLMILARRVGLVNPECRH